MFRFTRTLAVAAAVAAPALLFTPTADAGSHTSIVQKARHGHSYSRQQSADRGDRVERRTAAARQHRTTYRSLRHQRVVHRADPARVHNTMAVARD